MEQIVVMQQIMALIAGSPRRLTRTDLERELRRNFLVSRKEFGTALRSLLEENELICTSHDGHSFLEISLDKAVRITEHIILKPPHISFSASDNDVVISIRSGASFGTGSHPTTRLALAAADYALREADFSKAGQHTQALDIGTGSGVLAIAAVMMGIPRAIGIDTDPCARAEAAENARLNHLEDKISIENRDIETFEEKFSLILANLRYPTLLNLYPKITELAESEGLVIVSGIHDDEVSELSEIYTQKHFVRQWRKSERNWAALVFRNIRASSSLTVHS